MAAALNGRQVVAGTAGVLAMMGVCSCARDTDVPPSPMPDVITTQSADPSPSVTAEPTENPNGEFSSDGITSITAEFPAEEDPDNYVFSELPQSDAEQWLFESYPELWEQGVRAVSGKYMPSTEPGGAATLGPTVQYVDGVRYEGTSSVPLGFRGQDPTVIPSDTVESTRAIVSNPSQSSGSTGNIGQGGYSVDISENIGSSSAGATVTVLAPQWGSASVVSTQSFGSWQEAWSAVQGGLAVDGRTLYPGELGSIVLYDQLSDGSIDVRVWDQSASEWVTARTVGP